MVAAQLVRTHGRSAPDYAARRAEACLARGERADAITLRLLADACQTLLSEDSITVIDRKAGIAMPRITKELVLAHELITARGQVAESEAIRLATMYEAQGLGPAARSWREVAAACEATIERQYGRRCSAARIGVTSIQEAASLP